MPPFEIDIAQLSPIGLGAWKMRAVIKIGEDMSGRDVGQNCELTVRFECPLDRSALEVMAVGREVVLRTLGEAKRVLEATTAPKIVEMLDASAEAWTKPISFDAG